MLEESETVFLIVKFLLTLLFTHLTYCFEAVLECFVKHLDFISSISNGPEYVMEEKNINIKKIIICINLFQKIKFI